MFLFYTSAKEGHEQSEMSVKFMLSKEPNYYHTLCIYCCNLNLSSNASETKKIKGWPRRGCPSWVDI